MNRVLYRLQDIDHRLEEDLGRELKTRIPDESRVARLKKLKLAIKDRLHGTAPRAARAG